MIVIQLSHDSHMTVTCSPQLIAVRGAAHYVVHHSDKTRQKDKKNLPQVVVPGLESERKDRGEPTRWGGEEGREWMGGEGREWEGMERREEREGEGGQEGGEGMEWREEEGRGERGGGRGGKDGHN